MWSIDTPPLGGENGAMAKKSSKHAPEQIIRKLDKARELRESGSTTAQTSIFLCGANSEYASLSNTAVFNSVLNQHYTQN
ncbi:hypothetical protein [Actinomyces sp.]|uniref:hypothetical protein n=1 Tax=Actinomyces sp. TaxID=29317 RepID=UPI0011AF954F|nr:hypothetical protein [Actinomyces sp.]MDU5569246.1 hypothetical protein [Actinomyces sp.]